MAKEATFYYKEGKRMMDDMGCNTLDLDDQHYQDKKDMCKNFQNDIIKMIEKTGIGSQTYLKASTVLIK